METVKISQFTHEVLLLSGASWMIVDATDTVVGIYPSRGAAREAKADYLVKLVGKICKVSDYQFEVMANPAAKAKAEPKAKKQPTPVTHVSEVVRPCQLVWDIAEGMPGAKRGEVIAACVEAGIAFYTARTQYQQWRAVKKEEADRIAKQAITQ